MLDHGVEEASATTGTLLRLYKQLKENKTLTPEMLKATSANTWKTLQDWDSERLRKANELVITAWGPKYYEAFGETQPLKSQKLRHAGKLAKDGHTILSTLALLKQVDVVGDRTGWTPRNSKGFPEPQWRAAAGFRVSLEMRGRGINRLVDLMYVPSATCDTSCSRG